MMCTKTLNYEEMEDELQHVELGEALDIVEKGRIE